MPLFEYRCDKCETKFALLEGVTAEKPKRVCPKCGGRKLTKLISRPARIVKSEGEDDFGGDDAPDLGGDFGDDDLDDE